MGVGYAASALHLISYFVVDDAATKPPAGLMLPEIPGARYIEGPLRFRSPAATDVIAWRDRLATKYRGQLDELLTWDESSDFVQSEDTATSADLLLRYVAAVLDLRGAEGMRALVGTAEPGHEEIGRILGEADGRGFTSRFPQLLLVSKFWLPFQRNMIIEEPDWEGRTERFGSNYRLAEELEGLRNAIKSADPLAGKEREAPTEILWAAWQASETISRLCTIATSHHLPFWGTT